MLQTFSSDVRISGKMVWFGWFLANVRFQWRVKRYINSQLNWAIFLCVVIPEGKKLSKLRSFVKQIALASELSFPVVFHTENCTVHSGNPTVSSVYLPAPRWRQLKAHLFLAIQQMRIAWYIPFQNTTFYCTFYAFFSSFRIKLWPMWLVNSKRQPCVYPP